jgi:hypothetical protein
MLIIIQIVITIQIVMANGASKSTRPTKKMTGAHYAPMPGPKIICVPAGGKSVGKSEKEKEKEYARASRVYQEEMQKEVLAAKKLALKTKETMDRLQLIKILQKQVLTK